MLLFEHVLVGSYGEGGQLKFAEVVDF